MWIFRKLGTLILAYAIFLMLGIFLILNACSPAPANSQAPETVRRGIPGSPELPDYITVVTDQGTGCEYLASTYVLTPRYEHAKDSGDVNGKSRVKGCRDE